MAGVCIQSREGLARWGGQGGSPGQRISTCAGARPEPAWRVWEPRAGQRLLVEAEVEEVGSGGRKT